VLPRWLAPAGGYLGWRAVQAYLARAKGKRRDELVAQLPELARIISNAASAGRSLPCAKRQAARELEEPAAPALEAVGEELRLGQPVDRALERLSERLPSRELSVMVTTLLIQQRAGGDLVRALREMAATLDKRKDLRGEIQALMAGAVYTGYVVVLLGVAAVLLLNSVSPGVLDDVLSSWLGRLAFAAAVALYAVGIVLIRRQQAIEL
jgi:tight adherence protein B